MTDLADAIREAMEKFEEVHGRQPDSHEAKMIGTELFLALSVDQVFEAHNQMTATIVKWNEA